IAWLPTAKLIKRPPHVNSKFILNGYEGKDDALDYYDFSENPKSINPPSHYIYSANNQPDSVFGVLYQGYYLPEFRAKRIVQLLEKEDSWDTEKMKEMITDGVSASYPAIAQEMVKVIEGQNLELSQNQVKALNLLKNWKGDHQLNSLAPTIYYKYLYHILAGAMQDELGPEDFKSLVNTFVTRRSIPYLLKNEASLWWDDVNTEAKENRADIFDQAFRKSVAELEQQWGADPQQWKWQKVHTITHQHTLGRQGGWLGWFFNVGPLPINGGHEVINNLSFHFNETGLYPVRTGPSMRILIDFDDIENTISVLPTGQSGWVMSQHYNDQAQMYADGQFRKQMMNEKEIKENSRKLVLKVK
ncbi:MAG: penicillin acylase family protein, partial [Bacteroidota bacterium]